MEKYMEKPADKIYRFERKVQLADISVSAVELAIGANPAIFREIFYQRYINNIYFDTYDYESFKDNIDGHSVRIKYRIRWYGELYGHIEKPVLELKRKNGLVGWKESYKICSFDLNEHITNDYIQAVISKSSIPDKIKYKMTGLIPTLLNRYSRKYFISANGKFRLTVDNNLDYHKIGKYHNTFLNSTHTKSSIVLEVKYDNDDEEYANHIINHLPFRMTKNSKYANGIQHINNLPL